MRGDDLAPILAAGPPRGALILIGTVNSWNTTTGANSISTGGSVFTNVLVIGPLTGIAALDEVAILADAGTFYVIGKLTRP